jgi:hypothetical protein
LKIDAAQQANRVQVRRYPAAFRKADRAPGKILLTAKRNTVVGEPFPWLKLPMCDDACASGPQINDRTRQVQASKRSN